MPLVTFIVPDTDNDGDTIEHPVDVLRSTTIRDVFERSIAFECDGRIIWPDEEFGGIMSDDDSELNFFDNLDGKYLYFYDEE